MPWQEIPTGSVGWSASRACCRSGRGALDPSLPIRAAEMLIDVESLNVDAASFKQIRESCGGAAEAVVARIQEIVRSRGKMQNPETGSGGMLLGRVREVGPSTRRTAT